MSEKVVPIKPGAPVPTRAEKLEAERLADLAAIEELKKIRAAKKRALARAKHPRRNPKLPWKPDSRERHQIKIGLAAGLSNEQMAAIVGVTVDTFRKRCADLIATGADEVNAKVAAKLFQQIMRGNAIAAIYWTKTRLGWRETSRTEHTGADGGPIKTQSIAAEADAFRDKIETMAKRFALPAMAANDKAEAKPAAEPTNEAESG